MTDFVSTRADALIGLATVLRDMGRLDEAKTVVSEGITLYEQKGNTVAVRAAKMHVALLPEV